MKPPLVLLCILSFALAGCDSVSEATGRIGEKLAARDRPQVKVFSADQRATYEAARGALQVMNFSFVRGGPAQGELEAVSGLQSEGARGTRQVTLKARFGLVAAGGTEVQLWLKEAIEPDSSHAPGRASERTLRDSALYEAFFRNIQAGLADKKNQ